MELEAEDSSKSLEQMQQAIKARDKSDDSRMVGPLRPAVDTVVIDTTNLSLEEVVQEVLRCEEGQCSKRR